MRVLALALPGAEEGTSYGTPAFKVRGKLFVRQHDNREWLVVKMNETERAMRLRADPAAFFITDHYAAHPWVLVRLEAVSRDDLAEVLAEACRLAAAGKR
ncbi:MAG: MmcQ/YjbR family DNA-binding protein [Isosphaeraceae bacterium]